MLIDRLRLGCYFAPYTPDHSRRSDPTPATPFTYGAVYLSASTLATIRNPYLRLHQQLLHLLPHAIPNHPRTYLPSPISGDDTQACTISVSLILLILTRIS
jgi:hypothetical protein